MNGAVVRVVPALVATTVAAALVAGCSTGRPEVELSQAAPAAGSTTATVTVTQEVLTTVTATATVTRTSTVTVAPTVTVTALPRPSLTTATTFNQAMAVADYTSLVSDVRVLDQMTLSGNQAAVQLDVMARHLASLNANATPPGLDPPSYKARLTSLGLFVTAASDEATAGSPNAAARYAVIRQETGVLLSLVNGALKTAFALPPAPRSTTP